jgi:ferric-dicitrate binding protein FerR (iron transport regulator)
MNWQRAALVVAVLVGAVEVEWAGKSRVLQAGEQEVLASESPASVGIEPGF